MGSTTDRRLFFVCLLVGAVAAALKLVYMFFPFAHAVEALIFVALGVLISYRWPESPWSWIVPLSLLSWVLSLLALRGASVENLRQGVSIGWAYSLLVVPAAATVGAFLGRELSRRSGRPRA